MNHFYEGERMALVSEFEWIEKDRQVVHKPTRCAVSQFIGPQDKRYLQLDTYGTANREFPEKVSQAIQLDESSARQLVEIIRRAFPNLR